MAARAAGGGQCRRGWRGASAGAADSGQSQNTDTSNNPSTLRTKTLQINQASIDTFFHESGLQD